MSLVVATFKDNRNSVTNSSSDGKVESSSDSLADSTTISVDMATAMLQERSRSIRKVGSGINSVARIIATPRAKTTSL